MKENACHEHEVLNEREHPITYIAEVLNERKCVS